MDRTSPSSRQVAGLGKLHPAQKPSTLILRQRIAAAAALHQHEPHGQWIECDGREYLASKGCSTLQALRVRPTQNAQPGGAS